MSMRTILMSLPLLSSLISCTVSSPAGALIDGHLRPCPNSPNCVTSDSGDSTNTNRVRPLSFSGSSEKAWQRIQGIIKGMGGEIEEVQPLYLRAAFRSTVFHFVDDVELRMVPEEKVIHIRSGANVGYWDFGVNKKRVQKIRQLFQQESAGDMQPRPDTSSGTG